MAMAMRSAERRRLKHAIAACLYWTGVLHVWIRVAFRARPVVLMYHRVLPPSEQGRSSSHRHIVVSRDTFERHADMLRRLFRVVSLEEFVDAIENGRRFERPACLITFDDGWYDTRLEAWPILKRYGLPAVVFLPVNFIGTGRAFWQERLGDALYRVWATARRDGATKQRASVVLARYGLDVILDAEGGSSRQVIADLVRARKYESAAAIDRIIADVASLLPAGSNGHSDVDRFLDWDDVRAMAAEGVAFGSHGAEHRILTQIAAEEALGEIQTARAAIEQNLQAPVLSFSYPNGDWTPSLAKMVRDAGYRVAFTTGRPPSGGTYALRRVNVQEDAASSAPMLLTRILGLF